MRCGLGYCGDGAGSCLGLRRTPFPHLFASSAAKGIYRRERGILSATLHLFAILRDTFAKSGWLRIPIRLTAVYSLPSSSGFQP